MNPLEILEVRTFLESELPANLSHGQRDMFDRARRGERHWE
jgi:hypothetical protein